MRVHASCGALITPSGPEAFLLRGLPGAGKSDFLLRLIDQGFVLVADDQVVIENGIARPPEALQGVLEVRGLGLFRLHYLHEAPLKLVVQLGVALVRLPAPEHDPVLNLPVITIDPAAPSAPARLRLAMNAVAGRVTQIAGAFAA